MLLCWHILCQHICGRSYMTMLHASFHRKSIILGKLVARRRCRFLDTEIDGSSLGCINVLCLEQGTIRIASVDSADYWVADGNTPFTGICSVPRSFPIKCIWNQHIVINHHFLFKRNTDSFFITYALYKQHIDTYVY